MNPTFLNSELKYPCYVPTTTRWLRLGPFAMWLIGAARPKTLVELGIHSGYSYFCFCQAVQELALPTKCFAIGSWQSGEHSAIHGDNVLTPAEFINKRYASFSTLLRKRSVDALCDFEDHSIDLLHIDGRHSYCDAKGEFEKWVPKLSNRAIVLFHDTEVHEKSFDVWKFWNEISSSHPTLNLPFERGLGVLFWGSERTDNIEELLDLLQIPTGSDAVKGLFQSFGEAHALSQENLRMRLVVAQKERLNAVLSLESTEREQQTARPDEITATSNCYRKAIARRLAFYSNGKPRGWLRYLLFSDAKSNPRRIARRIYFKKNGRIRPIFATWYSEQAAGSNANPSTIEDYKSRSDGEIASLVSTDLTQCDALSVDVFDAALIRLVREPLDVFRYIEKKHSLPNFYHWRLQREREARERPASLCDMSLHAIYPHNEEQRRLELEAELACCKANPEVYELYRRALALKKQIIFVSDTHLRKQDVEKLLDQAGYAQREGVFVSSGNQEGDGNPFSSPRIALKGKRILHIANNSVADPDWSQGCEFSSVQYAKPEIFFSRDRLVFGIIENSQPQPALKFSHLLGCYRYWKLGLERTTQVSSWRSLGFLFAGPLFLAFARDLASKVDADPNIDKIYFASPSCDTIKKVFDLLYENHGIRTQELLASRRCMTFPLFALDPNPAIHQALDYYYDCDATTAVDTVFERFECSSLEGLRAELMRMKREGGLTSQLVRAAIERSLPDIRPIAELELEALSAYLQSVGFFSGNSMLVDAGWVGTVQDCLNLTSTHRNCTNTVSGAYLGVAATAQNREAKHGFLFDGEATASGARFQRHRRLIELLSATPLHSVRRMVVGPKGGIVPEYSTTTHLGCTPQDNAREIQRGVLEYCKLLKGQSHPLDQPLSPEELGWLFDCLSQNFPDQETSMFGGNIHH